jgi:hypothetical protein
MSQEMTVHLQVKLVQLGDYVKLVQLGDYQQHASLQDSMLLVEDMLHLVLTPHFALFLQMLEVGNSLLPSNLIMVLTSASNIQAQVKGICLYNKTDVILKMVQEIMLTESFWPIN